ncbi:MAG: flavodoxin family protein [Candidatus Thorarchaeota archaeon]
MNILFTYRTLTGNTKKVIEAMFDEVQLEKELKPWSEIESLESYDLCFVGFPIEMFGPSQETKKWLANHVDGKQIALVITHGSPEDAPPLQEWLQKCQDAATGADIIGLFHCRGDMSEQLTTGMLQSGNPQLVEWAKRAQKAPKGFPDAKALERARTFVHEIIADHFIQEDIR